MDKISLERIQKLHPKLRVEATNILGEIEVILKGKAACRFTFTLRTFAEQQALYNQGRTTKGAIVTNAKAGQSLHNYGLAIDFALIVDTDHNGSYDFTSWSTTTDYDLDKVADWMEVVAIFKRYGWEWGGSWKSFKDLPHFQKTFGYTWKQCLALHNTGKVDKAGYVLL